jgi:FkbM family methyltransferase
LKTFLRSNLGWLARYAIRAVDPWARIAYAQEGEDVLLDRLLAKQEKGFYVDVGAHHPKRFSNTHYFHMRGWRGINIEPNPAVHDLFMKMRRQDVNLQLGISNQPGELLYYEFDDPALNTFDEQLVRERESSTSYRVIATRRIKVEPLVSVLAAHLPSGQPIDFLNVDVEGMDLNVLRSNDWQRFRPRCVVSEALNADLTPTALASNPLFAYMKEQQYSLVAKTCNSWFFLDMHKTKTA